MMNTLNEAVQTASQFWPFALVAALFSLIKGLVSDNIQTAKQYCLGAMVSIPVGFLAGWVSIEAAGLPQSVGLTACAVATLVANDLVIGILKMSGEFKRSPGEFIRDVIAGRGRK